MRPEFGAAAPGPDQAPFGGAFFHGPATERRIVGLRVSALLSLARIAWRLGLHASTVHAVLAQYGCPRLAHLDRAAGVPVRRYERDRLGELVHIDIKKLGNIPDGGGHRVVSREQGKRNRQAHRDPGRRRKVHGQPNLGYGYLHTALDDHSRLAYTEILSDETSQTAVAFLARAHACYAAAGITIERVITDNGGCYRSKAWGRRLRRPGHHPQTHPALPAPDQRQGRAVPPHPDRRMGPMPAPTPPKPSAAPPLTPGSTSTTITGDTPRSRDSSHPPAASPTCQGSTPRRVWAAAAKRERAPATCASSPSRPGSAHGHHGPGRG